MKRGVPALLPTPTRIGKDGLARLRQQVLSRRRGVVAAGTTRTFPAEGLGRFALVTCRIRGHDFEVHVPDRVGVASLGWGSLDLTATRHRDGSVTATCHGTTP